MQQVRTLGLLVSAAFIASAVYALAVPDERIDFRYDSEGGRSISQVLSGNKGEFRYEEDGVLLKANWRGGLNLSDSGNALDSLDNKLEIEFDDGAQDERVVFENRRGKINVSVSKGGAEIKDADEAKAAADKLLVRFLRLSGFEADDRVASLYAHGGAAKVLEEMPRLKTDRAVRHYSDALIEEHSLSEEDLLSLAQQLKGMDSGQDLQLALSAIFENQSTSPKVASAILRAGLSIDGNHDIRRLLESAAEARLEGVEALSIALRLYGRMESDYELRKAAEALLAMDGLSSQERASIIAAAASRIENDPGLRRILEDTAEDIIDDPAVFEAWLSGFDALESSRNQRLAMEAAASEDLSDAKILTLFERVMRIDDSRDQRQSLEAFAGKAVKSPSLMEAYRAAAQSIKDDSQRNKALGALPDGAR